MNSQDILNKTAYADILFTEKEKTAINNAIVIKQSRGADVPYIQCQIRKKEIKATPEELIRQLFVYRLINTYQYPASRMQLEYGISHGREVKRADIVIFDKDRSNVPYIIVELKKPKLKDGKEQLHGYCNFTGAPIGIWTNGDSISYYHRKDPNYFNDIPDIPKSSQKLSEILNEPWTIEDLIKNDKLVNERKSLKDLILEMEDAVLANAGVDVFEEMFKLVFAKLSMKCKVAEIGQDFSNLEITAIRKPNSKKKYRNSLTPPPKNGAVFFQMTQK